MSKWEVEGVEPFTFASNFTDRPLPNWETEPMSCTKQGAQIMEGWRQPFSMPIATEKPLDTYFKLEKGSVA